LDLSEEVLRIRTGRREVACRERMVFRISKPSAS